MGSFLRISYRTPQGHLSLHLRVMIKKMKYLLCAALLLSATVSSYAQQAITWAVLADVEFVEVYNEEYALYYPEPQFGPTPKLYEGKEVEISGYVIPFYDDNSFIILSLNPYAACFFCGQSGPETVMEIELDPSDKRTYELDERATFKGTLTFNDSDVNHLTYILKNASRVEK